MLITFGDVKNTFFFSGLLIMLGLQSVEPDDILKMKNDRIAKDADRYLLALEQFDRTNSSILSLVSAMKNLFQAFEFWKTDEFTAMLMVVASMRRDLFPFTQYRSNTNDPGRIDVLLHRADDTMFAFTMLGRQGAFASLNQTVRFFDKDIPFYKFKDITKPIKHKVLIGLGYSLPKNGKYTVSACYLCDSLDLSQAVNVSLW